MSDKDGNEYLCAYVQQDLTNKQREDCYEYGILLTDYYRDTKILWRKQDKAQLTLTYTGCGRGRSSVTFYWVDQNDIKYPMFLTDMDYLLKNNKAGNEITADFEFVKRGANYGIKLCEKNISKVDEVQNDVILKPKLNCMKGLIYPNFNAEKHITKTIPKEGQYYISVDYGTVNPCSMGVWCVTENKAVRIREYYYSSRKTGWQLTDEEYYRALEAMTNDLSIASVIVDPSAVSFIECIHSHGRFNVHVAQNNITRGIRLVSSCLETGKLLFHESCINSIAEFDMYMWDEKAVSDRPMKEHDHAMDDIRYFCSTVLYMEENKNE